MSDHWHHVSEVQGAAEERHSHPDLEREIGMRAEDRHRHYDDERVVEDLRGQIRELRAILIEFGLDLSEAQGRIHRLEGQAPEARQLELEADLAAADREAWGGKEPSASYEEWVAEGRATTPEISAEPELPEDYERGQS